MKISQRKSSKTLPGFTLVELLVVIGIIALLSTLGYAGTKAALQHAAKTREISAAKNLMTAYLAYPADNNGMLLPGSDSVTQLVQLPDGTQVGGPTANRYPYRLAEYFNYKMEGTILVNRNLTQIDPNNTYMVSLHPALGMNHNLVGGARASNGTVVLGGECVSMLSQATSSPLVFASASNGENGDGAIDGYCFLTPPNLTSKMWESTDDWTAESSAKDYGNVHARYNGKAVCAFLDGSVRVLSIKDLEDMRLWSNSAAAQDNPDYMVKRTGGGRL